MAKKTQTRLLNRKYAFQLWQVLVFVVIFAGVGIVAILANAATRYSATLEVSPNPAQSGTVVNLTVTGCGYTPGAPESLIGYSSHGQWSIGLGLANSQGCLNAQTGNIATGSPGSNVLQIDQRNPKNGKFSIVTATTWVVQ